VTDLPSIVDGVCCFGGSKSSIEFPSFSTSSLFPAIGLQTLEESLELLGESRIPWMRGLPTLNRALSGKILAVKLNLA